MMSAVGIRAMIQKYPVFIYTRNADFSISAFIIFWRADGSSIEMICTQCVVNNKQRRTELIAL